MFELADDWMKPFRKMKEAVSELNRPITDITKLTEDREWKRNNAENYPNYFVLDQVNYTVDAVNIPQGFYVEVMPVKHLMGRLGFRDGCIIDGQAVINIFYGSGIDSSFTRLFYVNGTIEVMVYNESTEERETYEISFLEDIEQSLDNADESDKGVIENPSSVELQLDMRDSSSPNRWELSLDRAYWGDE